MRGDDPDQPRRFTVTRRGFLQYGGTLLAAVVACRPGEGEELAGLESYLDVASLSPSTDFVRVQRAADLVDLRLSWVNFERDGAMLVRSGKPGLLVVHFPPQHLGERAYDELGEPSAEPPPVPAQLAQPSRVVFFVPDKLKKLPLASAQLLELARTLAMNVHANAAPPPGVPLPAKGAGTTSGSIDKGPVEPDELETAIELPWRLLISPHEYGRWAHASEPQVSSRGRVELWHTRLGVVGEEGTGVDETRADLRTTRALWAREPAAGTFPDGQSTLTAGQRTLIVRGTADLRKQPQDSPGSGDPRPMHIERLMLSALGGTLDARTHFGKTSPLAHWLHHAAWGRDHYVEVAYRGFAFPFGHEMLLLQISERKLRSRSDTAYLWKRFVLVPVERLRRYDGGGFASLTPLLRELPFAELAFLDESVQVSAWPGYPGNPTAAFVPENLAGRVAFALAGVDRAGNRQSFTSTILWVPAAQAGQDKVGQLDDFYAQQAAPGSALGRQRLWIAPEKDPGDTTFPAEQLRFAGRKLPDDVYAADPRLGFHPVLAEATLGVEALERIAGAATPPAFRYSPSYLAHGFSAANPRELLLELVDAGKAQAVSFASQSDRSGGFLAPNLDVRGLSRLAGPVSDLATTVVADPSKLFPAPVDPLSLLGAKLFGCVPLASILADNIDFTRMAPRFVTDALDEAERYRRLLTDVTAQLGTVTGQVEQAVLSADPAAKAASQQLGQELRQRADSLIGRGKTMLQALFVDLPAAVGANAPPAQIRAQIEAAIPPAWMTDLRGVRDLLLSHRAAPRVFAVAPGLEVAARQVAGLAERIADGSEGVKDVLVQMLRGLELVKQQQITLEWRPPLRSSGIFQLKPGGGLVLSLAMRGKASGDAPAGGDLICALERFELALLPGSPIITIGFDKLQFRQRMGKKPEIDVVFAGLGFLGPLAFVQTLKDAIPLDGFSDPPGVEITPAGLVASFSLALPPLAVGMFCLENVGISAHLDVPFLGDALSFKFMFSTREKPFLLTVCGLGGTGYFGIEITPAGVSLLEAQLEFGAHLALNFGVASGAVTVMAGIYFRLEMNPTRAELSGFLRIRGEVDVLGLISASIELRLELRCLIGPEGTKVVGRAILEIEVHIVFFSISVCLECERKFAGANGDPTFADVMAPMSLSPGEPAFAFPADATPWNQYLAAYAA